MINNTQFLTTATLAEKLACSPFTVRNSRSTGQLFGCPSPKFTKLGSAILYEQKTVETWIRTNAKIFNNTAEALEDKYKNI